MAALAHDPEVTRVPLMRAQYDALVAQGAFDGVPVELLEGELIGMAPQGAPHAGGIDRLARRLDRALVTRHGDLYAVRQEKPFVASDLSEPEPDIAVVDRAAAESMTEHPSRAYLVVEVAESSRRLDLAHKPRVYGGAGVPLYWVVDLVRRRTVVHAQPRPTGDAGDNPGHDDPGYDAVTTHPFTAPLAVLDVSVVLADVFADGGQPV